MRTFNYTRGKELNFREEQEKTLRTPKHKANVFLQVMFLVMDLCYGRKGSLLKFKALEMLARYPYIAWENASYHAITVAHSRPDYPKKETFDEALHLMRLGRDAQDNEQLHLMLIEDVMRQNQIKQGWLRAYLIPRILSFGYYYLNKILYWLHPIWSFEMNAGLESHAEYEYMLAVQEHPEWEEIPVESEYFQYYPEQKTLADLMRRIALDERDHRYRSLEEIDRLLNIING